MRLAGRRALWLALATTTACHGPPASLMGADAGAIDAGAIDASPIDASLDAAAIDAASLDGAPLDAAPLDAAAADAAAADAAPLDAGPDGSVDAAADNPLGIHFTEVTDLLPIHYHGGRISPDPWAMGSGAAIADVDGDGLLDVFLARCDMNGGGPSVLLRQQPSSGPFPIFVSDPAIEAAFAGTCAHGVAFGDYDNDGDLDLFVTLNGHNRLYANDGAGNFTDVTAAAGVTGPEDFNTAPIWADVNADGLLDLFVLVHSQHLTPKSSPQNANRLYLNNGDGTFRDVTATSGAGGDGSSQAALIADLDGDGHLEIYVANDTFAIDGEGGYLEMEPDAWLDPVLFDGQGVPLYTNRSVAYGTDGRRSSMGVALADLNGDGIDDLYVSDWGANHLQIWDPILGRYDLDADAWGLDLPHNEADYYNVSWGVRFVDFDRDGFEELMIINGPVHAPVTCFSQSQRDLFLRRAPGTSTFVDITGLVGWSTDYQCPPEGDPPTAGRGVVIGDLDGDGDDDVIVTPYIERFRFFRNDTPQLGRHRVRVAPWGTVSAPDPVGAVLEVELMSGRTVRRVLYAGGDQNSQSARVVEAGLDVEAAVERAWLHWPSGYSQRLDLLPSFEVDVELRVIEPAWVTLSARVAIGVDPAPVLTYRPVDPAGAFLGAAGSGRAVSATRSDGVAVAFSDDGAGVYTAALPHPGMARITIVTLEVDGVVQRIRPSVNYK